MVEWETRKNCTCNIIKINKLIFILNSTRLNLNIKQVMFVYIQLINFGQ